MAHGQPDYGAYAAKTTVGSLADMAELAARLGSINNFDRRGDVIWWDDFEDSAQKWLASYTGGAGAWALVATHALLGGLSGQLSTFAAVAATARIRRRVFYPVPSKVGFEIAFNFHLSAYPIIFSIVLADGVAGIEFEVTYDYNTRTLSIVTAGLVVVTLSTTLNLSPLGTGFHTFKLVIDTETNSFVRLLIDSNTYDISAYAGHPIGIGLQTYIDVMCEITSAVAGGVNLKYGSCIVTMNEP